MKKLLLSIYVFLGCFILRLVSDYKAVFGWDEGVADDLYHPTPIVKLISEAGIVLLDMIIIIPVALLINRCISEKNEYKTLISLLGSCAIYDILFHIIKHIFA